MARTPEQKKLSKRKDAAYRFCKELAGLADLPKTAGGFDELLRIIDDGEGCFEFVFTWSGMAARVANESPEVE